MYSMESTGSSKDRRRRHIPAYDRMMAERKNQDWEVTSTAGSGSNGTSLLDQLSTGSMSDKKNRLALLAKEMQI